jgi:hypothetical protein
MQAKQQNDAKYDGGKENLRDVIVENLLIGLRGVVEIGFFLN